MKIINGVLDKSKLDKGILGFTKSAIRIALWSIGIVIIADSVGINTASLVTILGVVSLHYHFHFKIL